MAKTSEIDGGSVPRRPDDERRSPPSGGPRAPAGGGGSRGASEPDSESGEGVARAALLAAGDLAFCWEFRNDGLTWCGDVARVFGATAIASLTTGAELESCIHPEDWPRRQRAFADHLAGGRPIDCEYRVRRQDGSFVWVHERARLDNPSVPARLSGTLRPIDRRKQAETLLEQRANYDELTGHFNKARLRETLHAQLAYCERYGVAGGYLALGLDKLSMINDGFGHEAADAVIVAAGRRLERCLRATDTIGRLGSDRFGIVLARCDETGLTSAAEKILEAFRAEPLDTPFGPLRLTVSLGGVAIPGFVRTAQEAMAGAESALRQAKLSGRNCFLRYEMSAEDRDRQRHDIEVGNAVLHALQEDRILLAYQPVVCSRTQAVQYYETLLRMIDGDGETVAAGRFVPILEKLGLIRPLDQRALELAVGALRRNPSVHLAVNVSSLTVIDPTWMRTLLALLKGRPDVAGRLTVEITETAALEDFEVTARFVSAVRDLGAKVALDDFGSGYTSFRHMKALTVDVVKIDGTFVSGIAESTDNQIFVRTLIRLAEGFGLKTVAECIETAEEAAILAEEGVDFLQGWHFGRPALTPPWET